MPGNADFFYLRKLCGRENSTPLRRSHGKLTHAKFAAIRRASTSILSTITAPLFDREKKCHPLSLTISI
jgi:hypothetical protein